MKSEVEQLMATFNTHREDLQKQLVEAQKDKEAMMEFQTTLYVRLMLCEYCVLFLMMPLYSFTFMHHTVFKYLELFPTRYDFVRGQ